MKNENLNNGQANDLYNWLNTDVNLFVFLDSIDCDLELRRYANQNGRWLAQIEHADIKEGCILSGSFGTGSNPEQAIDDYVQQIRGKLLVIDATSDKRREIRVPDSLYFLR
jgi:hypothetical protein